MSHKLIGKLKKFGKRTSIVKDPHEQEKNEPATNIIFGRHPVMEAFDADVPIDKIFIRKGIRTGFFGKVRRSAAEAQVPVTEVDEATLSRLTGGGNHQGIAAVLSAREYDTVDDILSAAWEKREDPFILVLNEVQDTHNLGSLIRTSVAAGVHGIILPRRRSARLNPTVSKVAAGTDVYIKVALVTNISDALESLKDQGILVVGAEADGETDLFSFNYRGPVALVMGGEHKGLGERVKNTCDMRVKIPLRGPVESLNVGVAGAILLYRVLEIRLK